ncbi:MAG: TIGR00299 family protein [Nitrospirae bacterium CG_4_8_14_3_um_filter_44_28]|nr:MAG: TIGR00299 family protein [Nitrospirae bacterium CG_4_8_14_3_um_filter_44_28]
MKIAYFDCSSGISGDMCLGALVDAGAPAKKLENELRKLRVKGYTLKVKRVKRSGFAATKVDVIQNSPPHPPLSKGGQRGGEAKRWKDIEHLIKNSQLSDGIKKKGLNIFRRLFTAEAKVHGETFNNSHLHELGAVDCIVDIMGTLICLELLGIEKVCASPINLGGGSVRTKHGILPVPAPAAIEVLRCKMQDARCKIYSDGTPFELTTPTGAVILKELSSEFGNMPDMVIEKIGIGAGKKDFRDKPNVLRILIGNPHPPPRKSPHPPFVKGGQGGIKEGVPGGFSGEKVTVIETTIDDMNPQIYEFVMERLFKSGALDVYLTQLIMKKGRPGIKLTVLCNGKEKENLMKIIFEETTTIGVRFYEAGRQTLKREIQEINTALGKVKVKISKLGGRIIKTTPEYEDCKKLAKKLNLPLIEVMKTLTKVS